MTLGYLYLLVHDKAYGSGEARLRGDPKPLCCQLWRAANHTRAHLMPARSVFSDPERFACLQSDLKRVFELFDADGGGSIDGQELRLGGC